MNLILKVMVLFGANLVSGCASINSNIVIQPVKEQSVVAFRSENNASDLTLSEDKKRDEVNTDNKITENKEASKTSFLEDSLSREDKQLEVKSFCKKIDARFKQLKWPKSSCDSLEWNYEYKSEKDEPLIYYVFTGSEYTAESKNTTLVLGGVHADELNPVYMAFKIAEAMTLYKQKFKNSRIVLAPIVNPDGFLINPAVRVNANGVDLNRNLPTKDWSYYLDNSFKSDKRKFPGKAPNSENGSKLQVDLIEKYQPDKIISIHSPLGFLDIDFEFDTKKSPSTTKKPEVVIKLEDLITILSKSAGNYKVKKYGSFPGSLGNYAGVEREIPTVTLELSSSNPVFARKFWDDFKTGLYEVFKIRFNFNDLVSSKDGALK